MIRSFAFRIFVLALKFYTLEIANGCILSSVSYLLLHVIVVYSLVYIAIDSCFFNTAEEILGSLAFNDESKVFLCLLVLGSYTYCLK